jgi:diguanylate cyclase (GGDEF)-like protein
LSTGLLKALEGAGKPASMGPNQRTLADALDARVRTMRLEPNQAAAIFWAGGAVAAISVLPLGHWPRQSFLALVIIAGFCTTASAIRVVARRRLARWVLHVDVGLATVLTSVLAAIGVTDNVDFSNIYIWIALFAALYFRPFAVLAHLGGVGAAYAVALAFGPGVPNPVAAWLSIVGTISLAAAVMVGVVSLLRSTAQKDPLTGLANRRLWDERLDEELKRSQRTDQALSIAMIDLDGLKAVNDRNGHDAGDRLLEELARVWAIAIRGSGDFLARLGGDEFGLLAPNSDSVGIRRLTERLGEVLPSGVVVSIGVATWDGTENASDLLRRADRAMYEMKLRHRRGDMRLQA